MSISHEVQFTFAYNASEQTRTYAFDVAESIAADTATIKQKIQAINASLAAGTDDGLADFFVADDYDGTGGKLSSIKSAVVTTTEERIIF